MQFRYRQGDEHHTVQVIERPDGFEICIGERRYRTSVREVDAHTLEMWVDGSYQRVHHATHGDERWVELDGRTHEVVRQRHRRKRRSSGAGENTLAATMPGQITGVLVAPGDVVERGQSLVLMEAMKMELRVTAPHDGVVGRVMVAEGEAVERGQTLVELEGAG